MRIAITGGAGFIGSHLCDLLIANGHSPFIIDNLSTGNRQNLPVAVPFFKIDIRDRVRLTEVLRDIQPDAVSHQAASVTLSMQDPILDADVNIMGLLNVLECCAELQIRKLIFASSGGVIYGSVSHPVAETGPLKPISPYGISKWTGERYVEYFAKYRGVNGIVLRYSNVYGPRQFAHGESGVIGIFTHQFLNGQEPCIFGDGKDIRDFVYVTDVAHANLLSLTASIDDSFSIINIGTGIGTEITHVTEQLQAVVQRHFERQNRSIGVPAYRHVSERRGDLRNNVISPALAHARLGWQPFVLLPEGLQRTVEWFSDAME